MEEQKITTLKGYLIDVTNRINDISIEESEREYLVDTLERCYSILNGDELLGEEEFYEED